MKHAIPDAALEQHTAVIGKTGSGKTSTAKLIIEQVVNAGGRVCVLDPIKSDWWGLTSSASGKSAGLPFHILGGPRGHVPLHDSAGKAIAELVAHGELPHAILDMADFAPGGQARFFTDFAPMLLRRMRGVLYLVIEEAHLFAPKERGGFGTHENMSIHWSKMLATAGRSKGVRLIVLTQRTQALHNAILGSCDTLIAHRLTAPADQDPVVKWLKANTDKDTAQRVADSLSSLKTGHGWICSGEAKIFELVHFPRISTYDNTATPTQESGEHQVKMAPVDIDRLRAVIGEAVQEAEASDPKKLKARIAQLERELLVAPKPSDKALQRGHDKGFAAKAKVQADEIRKLRAALGTTMKFIVNVNAAFEKAGAPIDTVQVQQAVQAALMPVAKKIEQQFDTQRQALVRWQEEGKALLERIQTLIESAEVPVDVTVTEQAPFIATAKRSTAREGQQHTSDRTVKGAEQRILDALAELAMLRVAQPERVQVAFLAGYSHLNSKGLVNALGALRTAGLIDYPSPGRVELTDAGRERAQAPVRPSTSAELQERVIGLLGGASERLLRPLIEAYPAALDREQLASAAGYGHLNSKGFVNAIGRLRSLGFIDYPARGQVVALPVLFIGA